MPDLDIKSDLTYLHDRGEIGEAASLAPRRDKDATFHPGCSNSIRVFAATAATGGEAGTPDVTTDAGNRP